MLYVNPLRIQQIFCKDMTILHYAKYINKMSSILTGFKRRLSTEYTDESIVLFDSVATTGVITLNRPKRLNVLNGYVWSKVVEHLQAWESTKSRVIIKGAGDRAFSAGGDIKWLLAPGREDEKRAFVSSMLNGIYLISKYRIPYISLMDGITFGGGLALANGRYRIATERTVVAMPETRIGWLTDAGALYYFPRLANHLGFYMALTGTRLKGEDVVASGLATHFVPRACIQQLKSELCYCEAEDIETHLMNYSLPVGELSFAGIMKDVDYCFSAGTVEEIIERLSKVNNSWSSETKERLVEMCPTMLKVSLRALQYGKGSALKESLRMEHRVLYRCTGSYNYNAQEGLRSLMVDKDQPKWRPATLGEVTDNMVQSYFDPVPVGEELKFIDE